jgi:three-Cys-motif partner protein
MGKRKRADRWPELCERVSQDDGLPVRDVGAWTEDKLFYWNRYIEITTTAMVGNPKWRGGIVYVDLFGGPGICKLRDTSKRVPGSPLLAAWAPKPFSQILVCEKNSGLANACKQRLDRQGASDRAQVFDGDCNQEIHRIVKEIPQRSLTLAFVDPEGLHVRFDTLRILTDNRRVDLLVLFADRMDILRNVEKIYATQENSNLDQFMGPESNWRVLWNELPLRDPKRTCDLFADIYKNQLHRQLGFRVFSHRVMKSSRSPLYRIIYACKHDRGEEFWNKITQVDRSGQQDLPFED